MKKFFLLLFTPFLFHNCFAQVNSFLEQKSWTTLWNSRDQDENEDEDSPVDPGWVQQYYEMKKNAQGIIPRLPFDKIRAHDAMASTRNNLLYNIKEIGPYNMGGRTRAILIDRTNDSHVLIGSVSGGLFNSNDGGTSWSVVNDEMTALSISSLAQDHFNDSLMYAGTGEGWGNADGVVGNGVYRSTDGGLTFNQLPSTDSAIFNYIFDIATSPADSNSLYIATGEGNLYRSFNAGDSLQLVYKNSGNAISDIEITPTGGVWIAVYNKGIFYSASGDSGTFTAKNSGINTGNMRRIEIAIAPSDTTILYAMVERVTADGLSGFYRSDNFGQSWTVKVNPSDLDYYTTFTWYSMCIAVKPDDPDFVMMGVGDLFYTKNGGDSYLSVLNIHPDHHAIVFNPASPKIFYEGNDGGIYRCNTDTLYHPYGLNEGYRTIQYYAGAFFPSGINSMAGAQDNGTHKCKAGDSIQLFIAGGDGAYCAVNQQFPDVVYASSQNGNILRAFDGTFDAPSFSGIMNDLDGNDDGAIDEGAWFINPFEIDLVNGDYLGFVTLKRLWETFDGGSSWQPAMNQIGSAPFAIGISNEFTPTVYVGGNSALFMRIDNVYDSQPGDEVNLSASVPISVSYDFIPCIKVHPNDNSICYVVFSNATDNPRVWKVTNATTAAPTWTSISGDLPQGLGVNYIDVDPERPDDFFIIGTDYGVYVSDNGGANWYKVDQLPNVYTEQVKVRASDRRLFVYTHGRGSFTATLDSLEVGISSVTSGNFTPVVFPNPCSDEFTVKTEGCDFNICIRNVANQIVLSPSEVRTSGTIDVSSLPSGIYLVEMSDRNETRIKKLIKE